MKNVTVVLLSLFLAAIPCRARTLSANSTDTIQDAIDAANSGDVIELQPGTYTGPGNQNIDFAGKTLTLRSIDPNDPDTVAATVIDCTGTTRAFLFRNEEDANSVINGLTIVNGFHTLKGGAIYCQAASPTIKNCIITANSANYGAAIYCEQAGNPTLTGCLFVDNAARIGAAIYFKESTATISNCVFRSNSAAPHSGGAIRSYDSTLTITDSTFENNSAQTAGGAINSSDGANLNLKNCVFAGNSALRGADPAGLLGGALSCGEGDIIIANCLFAGNSAMHGGALLSFSSRITIANSTFADNYAIEGSTLYSDSDCPQLYGCAPSSINITNSILRDGENSIANTDNSRILLTFCNVPGIQPGNGNIDADPCFVDPGYWNHNGTPGDPSDDFWTRGDYHLKSQGWRWHTQRNTWIWDDRTSRSIDAGNPDSPLAGEPLSVPADPDNIHGKNLRINMGAYGGTPQASIPPNAWALRYDYNNDGIVNFTDLASWSRNCADIAPGSPGDLNPGALVKLPHLALFAGTWLDQSTWFGAPTSVLPLPPRNATDPDPPDGSADVPTSALRLQLPFYQASPAQKKSSARDRANTHSAFTNRHSPITAHRQQVTGRRPLNPT